MRIATIIKLIPLFALFSISCLAQKREGGVFIPRVVVIGTDTLIQSPKPQYEWLVEQATQNFYLNEDIAVKIKAVTFATKKANEYKYAALQKDTALTKSTQQLALLSTERDLYQRSYETEKASVKKLKKKNTILTVAGGVVTTLFIIIAVKSAD